MLIPAGIFTYQVISDTVQHIAAIPRRPSKYVEPTQMSYNPQNIMTNVVLFTPGNSLKMLNFYCFD